MNRKNNRSIIMTVARWLPGALLVAVTVAAFAMLAPHKGQAAPFPLCDTNGFLYKYPVSPTDVHSVDMVTGKDTLVPPSITGRQINAVGYNVKDNFIYGWDDQNSTFVRVHGDHTVDPITIAGYTGPLTGIIIGDVDENGHYWFIAGANWHEVDLNGTPTQIGTGSAAGITGSAGADWAFIPDTNALWRIMDDSGVGRLWSFDRTSHTWTNHTPVTPIAGVSGADLTMGAFYADPSGFLYASSNSTGKLWRLNVNSSPFTAVQIGTGNPSSSNDGARCALAPVPIDFGDAPSSYDTLLVDDGPRHAVVGYNNFNHTANLVLGKKVDVENDGFTGSQATGDDADDIDDERGVTHIVATPGTPTALAIPVFVTNSSSQQATLAGWVDLDSDGVFEVGERVTTTIPANSNGTYELNFPTATFNANSFARFRVFSAGDTSDAAVNLLPTGPAAGGEVEDVLVQVGTYDASKTSNPAEGSIVNPGETITYTLNIKNTGLTALTNLKIDDDLADVLDDATMQGNPTVNPSSAGSASVSSTNLEFAGDVGIGQTVTITYTVKIKDAGSLGDSNAALHNVILATHSTNCHPDVDGGSVSVDHADCQTTHTIGGLAKTGNDMVLPIILAGGLIGASGAALYFVRKRSTGRIARTNQE